MSPVGNMSDNTLVIPTGSASRSSGGGKGRPRGKGPWTAADDAILSTLVRQHGPRNWAGIAKRLPARSGKQCRERWLNHLDPEVCKGPWSAEEDAALLRLHLVHGNCWAAIARALPGRTENATKNRWNAACKKALGALGAIDPDAAAEVRQRAKRDLDCARALFCPTASHHSSLPDMLSHYANLHTAQRERPPAQVQQQIPPRVSPQQQVGVELQGFSQTRLETPAGEKSMASHDLQRVPQPPPQQPQQHLPYAIRLSQPPRAGDAAQPNDVQQLAPQKQPQVQSITVTSATTSTSTIASVGAPEASGHILPTNLSVLATWPLSSGTSETGPEAKVCTEQLEGQGTCLSVPSSAQCVPQTGLEERGGHNFAWPKVEDIPQVTLESCPRSPAMSDPSVDGDTPRDVDQAQAPSQFPEDVKPLIVLQQQQLADSNDSTDFVVYPGGLDSLNVGVGVVEGDELKEEPNYFSTCAAVEGPGGDAIVEDIAAQMHVPLGVPLKSPSGAWCGILPTC